MTKKCAVTPSSVDYIYDGSIISVDGEPAASGVATGTTPLYANINGDVWYQPDEFSECVDDPISPEVTVAAMTVDCAVPTSFQRLGQSALAHGNISFEYGYSSSDGSYENLAQCVIGELISGWSSIPNPPFGSGSWTNGDPWWNPAGRATSAIGDMNGYFTTFTGQATGVVTTSQYFQYYCSCNGGTESSRTTIAGPFAIANRVIEDSGAYFFRAEKTDGSGEFDGSYCQIAGDGTCN